MANEHPLDTWLRFFSPTIRFPAGGDIGTFHYQPYTEWEAPSFYRGDSQIERTVYRDVASPGSQLGTLLDAVAALAGVLEAQSPGLAEDGAIIKLRKLAQDVDDQKERARARSEEKARAELDKLANYDRGALKRVVDAYRDL